MSVYERLWRSFWAVVTILGVGVGLLVWTVPGAVLALATLTVLSWVVRRVLADSVPRLLSGSGSLAGPRWSFIAASRFLALCSFSWVSPPLGLFVVLTATISSPALVRRAGWASGGETPTAGGHGPGALPSDERPVDPEGVGDSAIQLTPPEAEGPLNGLDDRQLCRLWRDSFWLVRDTRSPGAVLCRVTLRAACLDELERRDSSAVQAWLDSGARASSGPEKFFAHAPPRDPL